MSDLQLGLLGIGVIVVVAVIAYNKWQEFRLKRRAEATFASRHRDVLFGERAEAVEDVRGIADRTPPRAADAIDRVEHTLGDAGAELAPARQDEEAPLATAELDAAVDFIIELDCTQPAAAQDVAYHAGGLIDHALDASVRWEGRDEARGEWCPVDPESRYRRVRVGLQLASRSGAVREQDLASFSRAVQELARALGTQADLPDLAGVLARAQALDRFCADVDVLIGLSVIGSESHTFPGTKIRALAESAGLVVGKDGRFHRFGDDGIEEFALANLEPMPFHPETVKTLQTRGVTALFDVPRVPPSDAAFRRFLDFAHELEQSLGGVLVDDNRKPIGQAALEAIAQQLDRIHATMGEHGIPAGGPLARRLFI